MYLLLLYIDVPVCCTVCMYPCGLSTLFCFHRAVPSPFVCVVASITSVHHSLVSLFLQHLPVNRLYDGAGEQSALMHARKVTLRPPCLINRG
jgi:hypothetical protein